PHHSGQPRLAAPRHVGNLACRSDRGFVRHEKTRRPSARSDAKRFADLPQGSSHAGTTHTRPENDGPSSVTLTSTSPTWRSPADGNEDLFPSAFRALQR